MCTWYTHSIHVMIALECNSKLYCTVTDASLGTVDGENPGIRTLETVHCFITFVIRREFVREVANFNKTYYTGRMNIVTYFVLNFMNMIPRFAIRQSWPNVSIIITTLIYSINIIKNTHSGCHCYGCTTSYFTFRIGPVNFRLTDVGHKSLSR